MYLDHTDVNVSLVTVVTRVQAPAQILMSAQKTSTHVTAMRNVITTSVITLVIAIQDLLETATAVQVYMQMIMKSLSWHHLDNLAPVLISFILHNVNILFRFFFPS